MRSAGETPLLELKQVSLQTGVGAHYLLQNVSFCLLHGDRVAIVGASGAGKTTLLRVLNRLSEITQGQIFFQQQEIRQIPPVQLRQQVVLVPQESRLLGMTVRAALQYPLQLRKLPQREIEQRLQVWLERLHIPQDWLERSELQLSVGQRQLVAIGRALMIQPAVLLLDEPTSALDAGRSQNLLEVLTDLSQRQDTAILMVNHQLELAQQFCTRMLLLDQGRVAADSAIDSVDWHAVKQTLMQREVEAAEEWQ
jgi:D-methionine transport system ATP-binding protein